MGVDVCAGEVGDRRGNEKVQPGDATAMAAAGRRLRTTKKVVAVMAPLAALPQQALRVRP